MTENNKKNKQGCAMSERKGRGNKKDHSKAKKKLLDDLIERFDVDDDFVKALSDGLEEYDQALENLANR